MILGVTMDGNLSRSLILTVPVSPLTIVSIFKGQKFYHRMANAYCRRNFLARVRVDGSWLSGEEEIKEGVSNAYQHLFAENCD